MIPGIIALPINSWAEGLKAKKQLMEDAAKVEAEKAKGNTEAKTHFKTVIVDTADIAYDLCEKYILDKEGVEFLDETEAKRGYRELSREFDKFFQEIAKAGYTLVIISHATSKQIKEGGEKFDKTIPTLPDRGFLVIARMVDVCGYASYETNEETGETYSMLTLRGNKYLEAGSRNPYMSAKIPFTYEALRDDMARAIDELEAHGGEVTNESNNLFKGVNEERPEFKGLVSQIRDCAKVFNKAKKMTAYNKIVTEYLGKGRKVMDCDESQTDMLILILDDLKAYIDNNDMTPVESDDEEE